MKKVLPIAEPIVNYIPLTNNVTAIINTNWDKYGDCVYKKFIQMANYGNHRFMFDDHNVTLDVYDCFRPFAIPKFMCPDKKDIRELLIDLIDRGYYVDTGVQTYYLKPYSTYKKSRFQHSMLIYGVSTDDNTMNCADFFKEDYSFETCDIDEVVDAIYYHSPSEHGGTMPYYNNILGYKLMEDYGSHYYSDNTNKILNALHSLIRENSTVYKSGAEIYPRFGISLFDGVISRIEDDLNLKDTLMDAEDIVLSGYYLYKMNFHFFYEHISLMKKRMIYLLGDNNKHLKKYLPMYDELCQTMLSCRNIVLRASIKEAEFTPANKVRIINELKRVKEQYVLLINILIDYLETL